MELAVPILLFALCAVAVPLGMILAGQWLGPRRQGRVKAMPYESGMDPFHDARRRFDVRFYLVAIAFLVFDVELLFLYPWAVAARNSEGLARVVPSEAAPAQIPSLAPQMQPLISSTGLVFAEVMVFLLLLAAGFVYAWRKGVFEWR
jgi:NADH-quinone oxidoreductase subunit A